MGWGNGRRGCRHSKAEGPYILAGGMAVERGRAGDVVRWGGNGRRLVGMVENDGLNELARLGRGLRRWLGAWVWALGLKRRRLPPICAGVGTW